MIQTTEVTLIRKDEFLEHLRIHVLAENYIVVIADTERFGKDGIMFEGNTFDECFAYIRKECGEEASNSLSLHAWGMTNVYQDRNGRTFPIRMEVETPGAYARKIWEARQARRGAK